MRKGEKRRHERGRERETENEDDHCEGKEERVRDKK